MVEGQVTPYSKEVTSASTKAGPLVLSLIQSLSLHLLDHTAVCSFGPRWCFLASPGYPILMPTGMLGGGVASEALLKARHNLTPFSGPCISTLLESFPWERNCVKYIV